jgi:hypothetical protein
MAAELCYPIEPQDEDLSNFPDHNAFATNSDADNNDDRPHFKVSDKVLTRHKGIL